ncbi:MAG: hypothetical protein ACKV22_32145 [Bryobacteraceae bacterium]
MRADGVVDQAGRGEAAVFQTHPAGRPEADPEFEHIAALDG